MTEGHGSIVDDGRDKPTTGFSGVSELAVVGKPINPRVTGVTKRPPSLHPE